MNSAPATDSLRVDRVATVAASLAALRPPWRLRVNHNHATLVSMRGDQHQRTVSVHADLLEDAAFTAVFPQWVASNGKVGHSVVQAALRIVQERVHASRCVNERTALPPWEPLGPVVDLDSMYSRLHGDWFAHTPKPAIAWSRAVAPGRQLTHIRFGCYRSGAQPRISLHPRLHQPWVARVFVEFVIFHELCHHTQACRPMRGETAHSTRFRQWERRYPHFVLASAWERAYLPELLAGKTPILSQMSYRSVVGPTSS